MMSASIKMQRTGRQHGGLQNSDSGEHDFDFLIGSWTVEHRKLRNRLANDDTWLIFAGTCTMRTLLGGKGNVDEHVLDVPGEPYRAASLRSYDAAFDHWSIWWLDDRRPGQIDPPLVGRFVSGTGTFYGSDSFEGRQIRVRFIWSDITDRSAMWQQAFSEDGGNTWETNWIMKFSRNR